MSAAVVNVQYTQNQIIHHSNVSGASYQIVFPDDKIIAPAPVPTVVQPEKLTIQEEPKRKTPNDKNKD